MDGKALTDRNLVENVLASPSLANGGLAITYYVGDGMVNDPLVDDPLVRDVQAISSL